MTEENVFLTEPCIEKNVEIQNFIRDNPGIQDGPEMFRCDDYGLFEKEQCGGFFTVACWCVNPRNGTRIGGVVTDGRANCETSNLFLTFSCSFDIVLIFFFNLLF